MTSWRKSKILAMVLPLLLAGAICLSLFTGSSSLSLPELWQQLLAGQEDGVAYRIFLHVRLPRTLAATLAGAALAVSGAIIQSVLNNSLASPNIIGVNSGAGFCALLAASLAPAATALVPVAAFAGALATSMLIYLVASKTGASRITLVLAGVAVSGILSAGMDTLSILFPDDVIGATGFMVGSFSGVTLSALQPAGWLILIGIILAVVFSYDLNVLALGEDIAAGLGMRVAPVPVPVYCHRLPAGRGGGELCRAPGLCGPDGAPYLPPVHRRRQSKVIPCSAVLGAVFALVCDSIGKLAFAPFELPVGILLSFLGGAIFPVPAAEKGEGAHL